MIELYNYQKQAVKRLLSGKHFLISPMGTGKTMVALEFARRTGKKHVLVVTTASVRDASNQGGGFVSDAKALDPVWFNSLSSFSIVSWAGLAKWLKTQTSSNQFSLAAYAIIFDEVAASKAGVSSQQGKAFLNITKLTDTWIGMTATPGDKWIDFYAYFCSCGLVKNKTAFTREYCNVQTFKGFPEIVGYHHEDKLAEMWESISYTPDTSTILAELPPETHQTIHFRKPAGYDRARKTRLDKDGEPLDNCFAGGTLVNTPRGTKRIEDIKIGDEVYSYNHTSKQIEVKKVLNTINKTVLGDVYALTCDKHQPIICTDNHTFYNGEKYIEAKDISRGNVLYEMQCLWKRDKRGINLSAKKNTKRYREGVLWKEVPIFSYWRSNKGYKDRQKKENVWERNQMYVVSKEYPHSRNLCKQNEELQTRETYLLYAKMQQKSTTREDEGKRSNKTHPRIWRSSPMPLVQEKYPSEKSQGISVQSSTARGASILLRKMWERICYINMSRKIRGATKIIKRIERKDGGLGERVSSEDGERQKNNRICTSLQNRLSTTRNKIGDRMRWDRASSQESTRVRQEETRVIRRIRVENCEILQQGNLKKYKLSSVPDRVYCIEVEDNHNFFVEGILTHNCSKYCHYLRRLCASADKMKWLGEYIQHLGDRCVVFYNYTEEGDEAERTLTRAIKGHGRVWRIDGKRHAIPTEATSGARDVVLVQWQAGAMGLNLQFINYWVSLSPNYSYSISVQGRGRIKRIGQKKHMDFIYLMCDNTIEKDIYKCLKNKSNFAEETWELGKE